MPKSKLPLTFLQTLHDQKEGYKFGEPQRIDEKALCVVLPIIRETSLKRQYLNFPETDKVEVIDTGSINKMRATNLSTENVFMRSGTIFKGSTQERTSTRSTVVFPGKTVDIEVRCVHASRGISRGANVKYGGISPLEVENAVYTKGFTASSQSDYWHNVSKTTSQYHTVTTRHRKSMPQGRRTLIPPSGVIGQSINTSILKSSLGPSAEEERMTRNECRLVGDSLSEEAVPTSGYGFPTIPVSGGPFSSDDLFSNLNAFAQSFDDILSKIKEVEHQSGMALINEKGCQTVEVFDHEGSWASLHKDAVKRVGSHVVNLDDTSVFAYKPENAIKAVQVVLSQDYDMNLIFEHKPSNGEPSVTINGLTSKEFVGEVVELDNRIIHLLLLKTAN